MPLISLLTYLYLFRWRGLLSIWSSAPFWSVGQYRDAEYAPFVRGVLVGNH